MAFRSPPTKKSRLYELDFSNPYQIAQVIFYQTAHKYAILQIENRKGIIISGKNSSRHHSLYQKNE
ncbi:hypothetical protein GCM10009597_08500 [Peribacillus frigoritolerans]